MNILLSYFKPNYIIEDRKQFYVAIVNDPARPKCSTISAHQGAGAQTLKVNDFADYHNKSTQIHLFFINIQKPTERVDWSCLGGVGGVVSK